MGQAVVIPAKPKPKVAAPQPLPKFDTLKVALQDTPRKDTVRSNTYLVKKGGEANLIQVPTLDTAATIIEEMPPQGPVKLDSITSPDIFHIDNGENEQMPEMHLNLEPPIPRLQRYNASSMLNWGQWEAKYFQQIYSQTHYFDAQGKAQPQNARSTYYSGIASVTLGCKRWFNFGVEAWLRSVRIDATDASPFKVLSFQSGPNSRTALSAVGPKFRFQPFSKFNGFSVQTALLIPVGKEMEADSRNRPYLATENLQWWTQFYYSLSIKSHWLLFAQLDAFASLNTGGKEQTQASSFALPASVYISYFPTRHITFYAYNQLWPTVSTIWYQAGLGAKVRFTEGLELECSYGRFLAGIDAAGPANAFNLGLRFVKW